MPSERKPRLILPAAVVAVLLVAYVGAYYAMVRIGSFRLVGEATYAPLYPDTTPANHSGFWMTQNSRLVPFFAPIHWLDRRIRPHVWEPTE